MFGNHVHPLSRYFVFYHFCHKMLRMIGLDLQRVQYRWPVGMPLVRPMSKGLFEVRTNLPDGTIARVLFCFHGGELFALHGFIKKAQKTPPADLKLARERMKEVTNG